MLYPFYKMFLRFLGISMEAYSYLGALELYSELQGLMLQFLISQYGNDKLKGHDDIVTKSRNSQLGESHFQVLFPTCDLGCSGCFCGYSWLSLRIHKTPTLCGSHRTE